MKKLLLLPSILLGIGMILSSCEKQLEIPVNFSYDGAKAYFTVPVTNATSYNSCTNVYFNADSIAKANNFKVEDLKSVKIKKVRLTIIDTDVNPYNFNLISRVEGFVGPSGSSKKVIDDTDIEQTGVNEVFVNVVDQEIKDMIQATGFNMCLDGALNDTIKHSFTVEAYITYDIQATALGKK